VEQMDVDVAGDAALGDPLVAPVPTFGAHEAARIAASAFGITGTASPLVSERDQNFRIAVEDGPGWVLKISNAAEDPGVVDMQAQAMLHIARTAPELPVMRIGRTLDGGSHATLEDGEGLSHIVRVVTFMPGSKMEPEDLTLEAVHGFGACSAHLGRALQGFFHPSAGHPLLWNLRFAARLRDLLEHIDDPQRRGIAERVLDRFQEHVQPVFEQLRAQVIHNDLTVDNAVLDDRQRISGVLDFGDMGHSAIVCDLVATAEPLVGERPDHFEALSAVVDGFTSVTPLTDEEIDLLPELLLARWTTSVVMSAWRVRTHPATAEYISGWDLGGWTMLGIFDELGIDGWRARVREAVLSATQDTGRPALSIGELVERRTRLLGSAISPLSYEPPLHIVRARGAWMIDADGHEYLDAYNNVPVVGHSHPRVVHAIARQAGMLNTNTRYLHRSPLDLAERLIATLPAGLDTVLFVNSGSEANDLAWRLATTFTGERGALVTEYAYHGVTEVIAELSPETWREGSQHSHVATIPAPDGYRGPIGREEEGWDLRYAGFVDEALETLAARDIGPAAMFVDPGFTSDGIFAPPSTYLQDAVRRWRDAGGVFVADEVQTGFGRPGSQMWGFQVHGLVPDIVTLGKPMGNGHPVAAVITRADIVDRFARSTEWFSTFGGNPVACEAALAVLDVLEEEQLLAHALEIGRQLQERLMSLKHRHDLIGDVRSIGLLMGVELVRDRRTRDPATDESGIVLNRMRERGVLMGSTGRDGNVLKIRPPLVISAEEADLLVDHLDHVLEGLNRQDE
jgi:4-aminobutyrate aminotransferase-like enzyme/Ser/Thr protein kinase RdoA (MazF antagonist)